MGIRQLQSPKRFLDSGNGLGIPCQRNCCGDLEVIASLSAGFGYPAGFEDEVKADSGCWIFKSAEQ